MAIVYYEGERIYFRPLEPEDEPTLRQWINDPRIWSTIHFRPPVNACREREWVENQGKSNTDYVFGITLRDGDRLIGSCGLHGVSIHAHAATLGIMIGQVDCHDQGFGSEAMRLLLRFGFEELNLNRIELSVFDFNARGIHVYEKCGFTLEGRRRQASYRHGQYRDVLSYGILQSEWAAQRNPEPVVSR